MANTGKTGADAIFKYVRKNIHTLARFNAKFRAAIVIATAAGALTAAEGAAIVAYLDSLSALDAALKKLADYCGFD